jgi:Skp family chaperone for outer membrane proteins
MKTLRLFTAAIFFAAIFAVSAFTQVPVAAATKIGVIDTRAFDSDKPGFGITKFVNGMNVLEAEFKPADAELQTLVTKYQNLANEIKGLQAAPQPNVSLIQTKGDEYGKLERDIKFKQEDAKARYQSRYNTVMGPIMQDIGKALQDFAKQKGYSLLLDAAKLDEAQLVLVSDPGADATKDFITFYNARPAGTAVAPK